MEKNRVLIVGLEQNEVDVLKRALGFNYFLVHYDTLPLIKLVEGVLLVESKTVNDKYLTVDYVIFHGIFDDDFDFITILSLWRGPCLPNAFGMLDLRQRLPGLARALQITRFGSIKRGMSLGRQDWDSEKLVVAKWGNWHCGENKHLFKGKWITEETSVIEEFITGEAVRIMIVGDKHWQIRLTGEDWLKSIHHANSGEMEIDHELLMDSENIARHFNLQMVGVDYMVGENDDKYLLEVNHIPNVTVFPFVKEAFLKYAEEWIYTLN